MFGRRRTTPLDSTVTVGSLTLPNPVMVASGTAGHGTELGAFVELNSLGAIVVKSLAAEAWPGNPPPRVHQTPSGMINSVGLQGPGVALWLNDELPGLRDTGARVVASIWGRSVDEYRRAADLLADADDCVIAVEVNVSCPNLEDRGNMFSARAETTAAVVAATSGCNRPRWAKLSPAVADIAPIAYAAIDAGAEAVTVANTSLGMVIDIEARQPLLGGGGGGLSGPAIHPIAVRAIFDVYCEHPEIPIIGVGGVASGADAIEMLMAGAVAVQVGTASFADPRATVTILAELTQWCNDHGVQTVRELTGVANPITRSHS
jgi:dihydroorotate dehydrogenase (NAD+) catalytic subunit